MAANSRLQRDYHCTRCGHKTPREMLTVKKSVFTEMGSSAKTFKSRVTRQLCPNCLITDDDWNREPYSEPDFETLPEGFDDNGPSLQGEEEYDPDKDPNQPELPLEPAHLLKPVQVPGYELTDSEGRPPGHPQYCGEGCIHAEDTAH
jgi:hypothetical protein